MPNIQIVDPSIYDALALFLSTSEIPVEPVELYHQRFRLWWEENPAFQPEMKRGWVLSEPDKIVGFVGNIPSSLQLAGKAVTAFSASTWRVLPEYRNQTMGLIFQWMALGKSAILFATTPTLDVVKILQASKFRLLPPAENRNASVLALNSRKVIASVGGDTGLAEFAALLGSPVADQVQKFLARKLHAADPAPVRRFCTADALFDDLWERTKNSHQNTNVRSSAWINWYCFQPPNAGKLLLGYVEKDKLQGYVICQPKKHDKLKLMECVDFWSDSNPPQVLPSLLHAVERFANTEGYDMVMFPHFNQAYGAELEKVGLLTREVKIKTNYFKAPVGVDINEGNSYFVSAEGDYGLA
jgi:hypothetical protein